MGLLKQRQLKLFGVPQMGNRARRHRRIGKIAEHTVDAELKKFQIFADGIAFVIGREAVRFVAKRPGVNQQSRPMGIVDQRRRRD